MPKITKRTVDAASPDPTGRRFYMWDTEIKGFGLLVLPSGVKSYFYRYRTPEGRERRATIGKHGAWTPDEARRRADEMRQAVKDGVDPLGVKQAMIEAPTVADVLDAYLASEAYRSKAPSTRAIDQGRIDRHLKPLLGRKHAHLLTEDQVKQARADIATGKTAATIKTRKRGKAQVRGGETTARDTISLLRVILNWAVRERLIKFNPCADLKLGSHAARETILEDAADYGRLFETLDRMERAKSIRGPVADAMRLIAFTGCRRGEAAGLRWRHVDLKKGLITLPASAHKTGKATGKPRIIGLPAAAQAVIAKQPISGPDDFVFKPAKGDGAAALSKVWRAVRVEARLPEGIGLHGLRHSLASHMAMGGAQAAEIMTAMGHTQISTAVRYVHWAQDGRQALAERAASVALAGMAAATDGKSGDRVVALKGGRQ